MKRILFILSLTFSFIGISQEVVEEQITEPVLVLTEPKTEIYINPRTPLSVTVVENETNIITTKVYKNCTIVKTEPKQ